MLYARCIAERLITLDMVTAILRQKKTVGTPCEHRWKWSMMSIRVKEHMTSKVGSTTCHEHMLKNPGLPTI